ncbi:MAG: Fe-S cluster assembly protein HesB [Chlorobiaceae bacterium]|nr:Fe-S cluster assembly protein HesB [Chlorobiaceae bacterium]
MTSKLLYRFIIKCEKNIDLHSTLFSGQSFRWILNPYDHSYSCNLIGTSPLLLKSISDHEIEVISSSMSIYGKPIEDFITSYFTLDIDINAVFPDDFHSIYPNLWEMVKGFRSVKVMRQDPFEIMVTFMCAQGIGMHLIRRQVEMIAERYGEKLVFESEHGPLTFYSFPTPSSLASAVVNELAVCTNNNRIRAANIISMARSFESGAMAIACVRSGECSLDALRDSLCVHSGIGMKIADCIALFGLGRFDAFPIDTHVKQYLWEWFGIEAAQRSLTEKNYRYLQDEARKILGNEFAGYAGHILFHCWRKEVRKMKAF